MGEQTTPATAHDAHGWRTVGLGPITVAGVVHKPGIFIPDDSDQHLWVCRTCTDDAFMPAWPCAAVQDSADHAEPPFRPGDRVVNVDGDWCTVVEPGMRVALASDVPNTGVYWDDPATLRHLDERLAAATDSAGPASSSASTGGTGGLAEVGALLARLDAATAALTTYSQMLREQIEGQRRELWDAAIVAMHNVEQTDHAGSWDAAMAYAGGLLYAHHLMTGIDGEEQQRLLAAELDSRYGTDRTTGGGPS